jgi:hypothetical protein
MSEELTTWALAKPCPKCKGLAYDTIIKLNDNSRVSTRIPTTSIINPKTENIWWDYKILWTIKEDKAYIKNTDTWTYLKNII